jgi:hypothetical protein
MPDAKVSALPNGGTPADTDIVLVASAGASETFTMNQLTAYFESRARQSNGSLAAQAFAVGGQSYVIGSNVTIPTGRLQAKTMYRCRFNITKTAAGTIAPVIQIHVGTGGVVGDSSKGTHTFAAQTAAVDSGLIEVYGVFRTVGAGTSAVLQTVVQLSHALSITGFSTEVSPTRQAASPGFDSTVAGLQVGVSVSPGAAAAWTTNMVQAELFNLA